MILAISNQCFILQIGKQMLGELSFMTTPTRTSVIRIAIKKTMS